MENNNNYGVLEPAKTPSPQSTLESFAQIVTQYIQSRQIDKLVAVAKQLFESFIVERSRQSSYDAMLVIVERLEPVTHVNINSSAARIGNAILDCWVPQLANAMNSANIQNCIHIIELLQDKYRELIRGHQQYQHMYFIGKNYFCLGKKLGAGQFASVFLGKHIPTAQTVAIKVLNWEQLSKVMPRQYLDTEVNIMKEATHNNVVRLHDVLHQNSYLYLVMEYCSGGTLEEYLQRNGRLSEDKVRHFMRDIAMALRYLHYKKIIHRDLKPGNILMHIECDGKLVLKVADFTFARFLEPSDMTSTFCGSPLFMAPEIFNDKIYNSKGDLWSVGVIMYLMLFGQVPFGAKDMNELMVIVKTKPVPIPPESCYLSNDCRDLLMKLLQKVAAQRIEWEAFFKHPFLGLSSSLFDETATELQRTREAAESRARELEEQIKVYRRNAEILEEKLKSYEDIDSLVNIVKQQRDSLIQSKLDLAQQKLDFVNKQLEEQKQKNITLETTYKQQIEALNKELEKAVKTIQVQGEQLTAQQDLVKTFQEALAEAYKN